MGNMKNTTQVEKRIKMSNQTEFEFMKEYKTTEDPKGRLLTVRLIVTDQSKAKEWLWNMKNNPELGIHITGLSDGDMFDRESLMEETLEKLEDDYIFSSKYEENPITELFYKIDKM